MDNELSAGLVLHQRYEIRDIAARSRVGTVYSAFDLSEKRPVVVKLVSHRFIPGAKSLVYLDNLFVDRQSFHHPNLISVLDSLRIALDSGKETVAAVLEPIGGRPVSDLLPIRAGGTKSLSEVLFVLSQVAEAMEYLHSRGVEVVPLHPRRVFIEPNQDSSIVKIPTVGYFTNAEWIRDGSRWGCTTGVDYRYVAPEMLEEGSFLNGGEKADIYLFGLLMFELIVGVPPFEANRETLIQLQRTEPIPDNLYPTHLPCWLFDLTGSLLAKDPAQRPTLAATIETLREHLTEDWESLSGKILPADGDFVRVLFVGDNRLDQLSVARMAKSHRIPFHYRIAQTIEKAEEILEHREVDVIVTDHHLPDGTSFDLLRAGSPVPVIVITGSEKSDLRDAVLKAGAFACVTKDLRQAHLKSLPELVSRAHKREM